MPTSAEGAHLICEDVRGDGAQSWCNSIDFIVDAGERPVEGSTIFDLTDGVELVRTGMGSADISYWIPRLKARLFFSNGQ